MVEKSLKILHLEDNLSDVILTQAALAAAGIEYEPIIAVDGEQFIDALMDESLDLIISDYSLSTFDGLVALKITREIYPDLPFIFLTGTMGEERAGDSLQSGATDFVLKGRLGRLGQTVRRALKSKEDQSALWQTADLLRIENERFRILSAEFKTLLDGIPDKITLRSPDFKVIWANKSAVGDRNREKEIVGRHCYESLHNNQEHCDRCPAVVSFRTGELATAVIAYPDKSIWELRAIPICDAGNVISVIEIARDISEHRRLEDRYFHAQKLETVGTLASGIAHDFNNILTCIGGYGQMIKRGMAEDDPQRNYINIILDAADRAARLTSELLQFSKKQPGEQKPVDLNNIIKTAEKFFKKVISENIEVLVQLHDEPLQVLADRNHLEQVLMNLTTNASDAMARYEKGLYTITTGQVTLGRSDTCAPPGDYALVTISDTGEGMEPATQQRIFEPFFTTKEVGKGTGLGLAAVYGIIKQHGGEINLTSEKNKGTTFRIYLPLITANAQEETGVVQEETSLDGTETILLAEDDGLVRSMAKTFLTDYGYSVIDAENGEEAVKIFLKNQENIDLLLFDLIMPQMSGLEACTEIQKVRPGIKALIASGYLPEVLEMKTVQGISLVEKPYNPRALLQKVRRMLDGAE
jgi:signal transduction histidine kinase/DNA-binding response OmpR family regulator